MNKHARDWPDWPHWQSQAEWRKRRLRTSPPSTRARGVHHVGSSPGGGYDLYGRLLARHMGKHLPGNLFSSCRTCPALAAMSPPRTSPMSRQGRHRHRRHLHGHGGRALFTATKRTTHHPTKFHYIGSANTDYYVCLVRGDAQVKTFEDLFDKELVVGGSAGGASTRDFPLMLRNVLGAKFKIVAGYPGTREINLAIQRNEVQGGCGQTWSSVTSLYKQEFAEGRIKPSCRKTPKARQN